MPMPFFAKPFTFTNPDGTPISVIGWGDQHYAVFETTDGYTVIKDPGTGYYHYAALSDDKNSLIASTLRVGAGDPRSLGVPAHIRVRREAAREQALAAHDADGIKRRWEIRREEKRARLRRALDTGALAAAPEPAPITGTYVGLCILIQFPNVPGTITQQEVSNFCNQPGYANYGNNGSVYDYFFDNSQGKLRYTNVVTAYYTAAHQQDYYTDPAISYGTRARELIVEALNHLKSTGFNFAQLSSDSAGYIYALNIFYAGPCVNNWAEGLWPHSWGLAADFQAAPGKKFRDYQITNIGNSLTLGTFCHENGHMVCDFPDLYDYGYESNGVGNYCLMCFGGPDTNPSQICAYLKYQAGWATQLTPLAGSKLVTIAAGTNDFGIYARNQSEYFLVENRQRQGRDLGLPDVGLLVWHIDELGSNNNEQMTPAQHYECALEQADNRFDLERRANGGDSDDLFGAPYRVRFAGDTAPASRWWDNSDSGLTIDQISAPGPSMTFRVGTPQAITSIWPSLELLLLDNPIDLTAPIDLLLDP